MKVTGMTKKIDSLGRIVLPAELRKSHLLSEGDRVEIYLEDDLIILKKADTSYTIHKALMKLKSTVEDESLNLRNEILTKIEELERLLNEENETTEEL